LSQPKGKFSKILVAIDGSQPSMDAAYYAVAIAKKEDTSELIALHVVFSQIGYAYSSSGAFGNHLVTPGSIKKILESSKNEAKQWFDKIKEKMNDNNNNNENSKNDNKIWLKTEVVVSATSIVDAIIEYAEQQKVDLIVIGTRRRSNFTKLLLGSVASGVITCASCPVMVVK
jgi:nucleotide-binding universal stress UspA family protein